MRIEKDEKINNQPAKIEINEQFIPLNLLLTDEFW